MQEENTSQETPKKFRKYIVFLFIGVFVRIIAIYIEDRSISKCTIPSLIIYFLWYLIPYLFIFGLIALIVSQRMGGVTKYWLPVLAWLFLIFGLFNIVTKLSNKPSNKFVFKTVFEKLIRVHLSTTYSASFYVKLVKLGTVGLLKESKFTTKGATVKLVWPC